MATARMFGTRVTTRDRGVAGPAPDTGGTGSTSGGTVRSVGLSLPSIFSVSGSPVQQSGTLAATLAAQAANLVFAGPSSGGSAAPSFRALVDLDIPAAIARDSEVSAAIAAHEAAPDPHPGYTTTAELASALAGISAGREVLTGARTYYVRTDGNDANNGLANTSGGAFATLQKAINTAASIDHAGFQVTIQVGAGTYSEALKLRTCLGVPAWSSVTAGGCVILGDATTPGNVIISAGSSRAFEADGVFSLWQLRGLEVRTTGSASGVFASSARIYLSAFRFGAIGGAGIEAAGSGSTVWVLDNYTIAGSAARHLRSRGNAQIEIFSTTITLSGTPAFSTNFATVATGGVISVNSAATSFSGSATGTRYSATGNGVIDTAGGASTYFPGNAAGAAATGGQYL